MNAPTLKRSQRSPECCAREHFPPRKKKGKFLLAAGKIILCHIFRFFYSMSLHSAPSIVWELSGEPCETRDQALSGIKNNTEAFIICSRGDEFLQATCNSPENYHCEISFASGKDSELYMTPKDLDYSRLHDLFSRYAAGEDLSHLKKEWTLDAHKPGYITAIVVVLAIIAVLAVIIFSS